MVVSFDELKRTMLHTYNDQKVAVCSLKIRELYTLWQCILRLKPLEQVPPKARLNTKSLQDENAHPHNTLFRRVGLVLHGIEHANN